MSTRKSTIAVSAIAASLLLALSACAPDPADPGKTTGTGTGTGSAAPTADVKPGCEDYAVYGDLSGKTVSIYTSIVELEGEDQKESYKQFEECTGATIDYEGSREFEDQLPIRIEAGNAPDIAYLPQPGLLKTLVANYPGKVIAASEGTAANVDKFFSPSWKDYGTVDGTFYAAPLGANMKSFVWYNPGIFTEKGYAIPTTWDEMLALTDKIAADYPDSKPWCAGIESGGATGWPATDWVEDVMLRTAGPDVYDKWVSHEIPFNDPQVVAALDAVGAILKDPARVNGGFGDVKSIATTPWTDGGLPIIPEEGAAPKCFLHRAANFYQNNWPKGTTVAEDGDVFAFYLPGKTADDKPVLGGGEFVAAFRDAPEVAAFQAFLASDTWANAKAKATEGGGWVSANSGLDVNNLATDFDKLAASVLGDKNSVIRFDASDLMPAEVGAGSFWKEMVKFFSEDKSSQAVADAIEKTWP
ncbi:ABC transporter substrate-binding protein [Sanguibacter sp. HDW7]|uniref:ABC transporter substrate-binding protein n=1 Tax=Sanguibacter sp. HDW7 TaxID=2714931 RepID=UPI00140BBD68|nr:ABC transporter substrate-binding protein [Sanguibacter sp. HDW7]QIK82272.1 carbohydrate ABC transporter substrate-binding protein [Sanguibacter sp. HDW7]